MRKKFAIRDSLANLLATGDNKQIFELPAKSRVGSYILDFFKKKASQHRAFSERVRWDVQSDSRDGCFNKIILVERIDVYILFGRVGNLRVYINRVGLVHLYSTLRPRRHRNHHDCQYF